MPDSEGRSRLANSREHWQLMAREESSPFIRTLGEWDEFAADNRVAQSSLKALDSASINSFRSHLKFVEITVNGQSVKRCCISWYYGDLQKKHQFTMEQVLQVAELFGIGPDHFHAQADKFGDLCDDEVCCRPRTAYSCPDGAGDCTC